jgi:glycosyltransferase involved in cell wall biosynthesis
MPKVSVVIPTYNRQRLVQGTIDSVLRQTFRDVELIVIDDGSTDDTRRVLQDRYGARIRYIYQENQGESAARNHGIALACGEYVAFVDSDDLWHPQKLDHQVEVLDTNPGIGLSSTQAYWINYKGLRLHKTPDGRGRQSDTVSWRELVLDNVIAGGGSSALIRKECLERTGGFDQSIRFGEEWDLWIRIAHDYRVQQIPVPLVYYRLNPFGTRSWAPRASEAETMYREHLMIVRKAFEQPACTSAERAKLEAQAYSRLHLRYALVNYGHGAVDLGNHYWQMAIDVCPEYATDRELIDQTLVDYVTGFASIAEPHVRLNAIEAMLDRVLSNLPKALSMLRTERRALLARCLAEMAFVAALNEETSLARRCAYHCCASAPEWLNNRGLLKILITGGRHLWPEPIVW